MAKKTRRKKRKPDENELLMFRALYLTGWNPNSIAVDMGWDAKTVRKYVSSDEYYTPFMKQVIEMAVREYQQNHPT